MIDYNKLFKSTNAFTVHVTCDKDMLQNRAEGDLTCELLQISVHMNGQTFHFSPSAHSIKMFVPFLQSNLRCVMYNASAVTKILDRYVLPMEAWRIQLFDIQVMAWMYHNRGAGDESESKFDFDDLLRQHMKISLKEERERAREDGRINRPVDQWQKIKKLAQKIKNNKLKTAKTQLEVRIRKRRKKRLDNLFKWMEETKNYETKKQFTEKKKQLREKFLRFEIPAAAFKKHLENRLKRMETDAKTLLAFEVKLEKITAKWMFDLYKKLRRVLWNNRKLGWWTTIEQGVRQILMDCELTGIKIDRPKMGHLHDKVQIMIEDHATELRNMAFMLDEDHPDVPSLSTDFNPNSPEHVSRIVYDVLNTIDEHDRLENKTSFSRREKAREKGETEPKKFYSVSKKILENYKGTPFIGKYLYYNSLKTIRNSFLKPLSEDYPTEIQFARFDSTGTDTGRFTSYKIDAPGHVMGTRSVQQIPSRDEMAQAIRDAFVKRDGQKLIVADLSQIELRVAAVIAEEKKMIQIYNDDGDIHQETNDAIKRSKKFRWLAKNCNFGLLYGGSAKLLHHMTGLPLEECVEIRNNFFDHYAGLLPKIDELKFLWESGYDESTEKFVHGLRSFVIPFSGRKRHWNKKRRSLSPGTILNTMVQGSAADVLKAQIYFFFYYFVANHPEWGAKFLMQVHDEVVIEVKEEYANEAAHALKYVMEFAWWDLPLPLKADVKVGDTWGIGKDDDAPDIDYDENLKAMFADELPIKESIFHYAKQAPVINDAELTEYGYQMFNEGHLFKTDRLALATA